MYIKQISLKTDQEEKLNSSYISTIPAVKKLGMLDLKQAVTFFVGENGSGKSTLLEAVAVAYGFNAEGGSKNFTFSSRATHSDLHDFLRLSKGIPFAKDGFFLRAESFYNVASNIEEMGEEGIGSYDSYGGKSLHAQSHGESFISLVQNRFWGNGLYILDEPEAALSPARQLALMVLIRNLVQKNSQFIIATHSPILMAYPNADVFVLNEDGIERTPYEQTEHYFITKRFLDQPERMLKELVDE